MAVPLAASNNRLTGFLCGDGLPCLAGALGTVRPEESQFREGVRKKESKYNNDLKVI